ncbi:MAG: tetratricopeptide repeat protein [Deltaproteobacteria bacterium]|nr:tetratricopeptide repeat protein [Deltaproteobacteria bacterium]
MSSAAIPLLLLLSEPDAGTEPRSACAPMVVAEVLVGVESALTGDKHKDAKKALEHVVYRAPDTPGIEEVLGWAMLTLGDKTTARRVLGRFPSAAVGAAKAEVGGPGGMARARTRLSDAAKDPDAPAGVLFLTALAFAGAGQSERAHELLSKAIEKAPGSLDEAFAPDAHVQLARAALRLAEACGDSKAAGRIAWSLVEANRIGEAQRLAESALKEPVLRPSMLRLLINTVNASDARRALERVDRVLASEPTAADALAARVVLLLRARRIDEAKRALVSLPPIDEPLLSSSLALARAELAMIDKKGVDEAMTAVEAAIREDPKNDRAVALYARLLLSVGKIDRAAEFAVLLLGRRPQEVDPFSLLAEVHEAKGQKDKAKENRLRSAGFVAEKRKLERAVLDREAVFRAIRDAEGGVGVAGLEALRGEHPSLSLPVDLALARLAGPGAKRAARERILSACSGRLLSFLDRTTSFDAVKLDVSFYGQAQSVEAPLTAADPARCASPKPLRK